MSNNLDHLFKNALRNRSSEPPPHIWKNIEADLHSRRKKYIPWWIRSVAAVALAAAAAIWLLQIRDEEAQKMKWVMILPPVMENIKLPENLVPLAAENTPETPQAVGQADSPLSQVSREPVVVADIYSEPFHSSNKKIEQINVIACNGLTKIESAPTQLSIKEVSLRKNIIPLVNGQALKNGEAYHALLKADARAVTGEENKEKNEQRLKFALSGHVAPVYTSGTYHTTATNARGYQYSNSQMSGTMNVSGGLKLSIAADKKLSIQTGIFYSRMGQQTDEKISHPQSMAFESGISHEPQDYIVTPWGNLKSRTKPVAYRSEEAVLLSNNNNSRTAGIEQVFNTVEIPLALRYRFFDQKLKLSVAGGFSGNFIVDNNVYMIKGTEKEYVGSTEDIRRFNLSTDLGLGIEYPIARNIKVMLEPGFKYYLQSISQNAQIDFKPYVFSLSTGIGIEF